jgi:hypothetical protein
VNPSDHERSELDAVDDAALNEYLRRDSAVSQRYRELDADQVPAALDQAVLAQAHAAVAAKKRASRWSGVMRWSAPLALAASVVLVMSIVLQPSMQKQMMQVPSPVALSLPKIRDDAAATALDQMKKEAIRTDAVEPAAALEEKTKQVAAPARIEYNFPEQPVLPPVQAPAAAPPPPAELSAPSLNRTAFGQAVAPAAPAIDQAVVTASRREAERAGDDLSAVTVTSAKRKRPNAGAGPRGTLSLASEGANAADQAFDKENPNAWLDYIRRLRAQNETSKADAEWRRFLQQYPDFKVDKSDAARPSRQ